VTEATDAGPSSQETVGQALERAGRHARSAAAESVAALEALLDAASLAAANAPGRETLPPLAATLAELRRLLSQPGAPSGERLVDALLQALEAEIARWERRGSEDPEARAVLRAFLGMREILWELGVRAPHRPGRREAPEEEPTPRAKLRRTRRTRLQRVEVEG
jgi:hypothetical protein